MQQCCDLVRFKHENNLYIELDCLGCLGFVWVKKKLIIKGCKFVMWVPNILLQSYRTLSGLSHWCEQRSCCWITFQEAALGRHYGFAYLDWTLRVIHIYCRHINMHPRDSDASRSMHVFLRTSVQQSQAQTVLFHNVTLSTMFDGIMAVYTANSKAAHEGYSRA